MPEQKTRPTVIPLIERPANPNIYRFSDGQTALIYASEESMRRYRNSLFDKLHPNSFDVIVVNQKGGRFMSDSYQDFWWSKGRFTLPTYDVEYHRTREGVRIDKPIPLSLKKARILIAEDVFDRGATAIAMLADAPRATVMVAVTKLDVPNQFSSDQIMAGVNTRNVWLAGNGMNFGSPYPDAESRNFGGLLFRTDVLTVD